MATSSPCTAGSFRDPSGFVFVRDGVLCRQVNRAYQEHYDHLMASGLYDELVGAGLLVAHEEAGPVVVKSSVSVAVPLFWALTVSWVLLPASSSTDCSGGDMSTA